MKTEPKLCFEENKERESDSIKPSNHCANRIEIGIEADNLSLDGFGTGVVHGVFESSLTVVVFMHRAAGELRFIRLPAIKRKEQDHQASRFPSFPHH